MNYEWIGERVFNPGWYFRVEDALKSGFLTYEVFEQGFASGTIARMVVRQWGKQLIESPAKGGYIVR